MKAFALSVMFISSLSVTFAAGSRENKILAPDGMLLAGVDGKVIPPDTPSDKWFFEFDISNHQGFSPVLKGAKFELLPCPALEKTESDANSRGDMTYKLWGIVTRYKERNYIFTDYVLPVRSSKIQEPNEPGKSVQSTNVLINEPNDELLVPKQIVDRLQTPRIARSSQSSAKGLNVKQNFVLFDKGGFITRQEKEFVFVQHGLGRNTEVMADLIGPEVSENQKWLWLLPCGALERAEIEQSGHPEPLRFKIAGIVTQYKGQYYLLLQRATLAYSNENFFY